MSPVEHVSIAELAVPPDRALPGFDFPAPRHPAYLLQERTEDVESLLPLARSLVRRKYGRLALDVAPEDEILLISTSGVVIRTAVREIASQGRDATGVRVMNLDEGHSVATAALVPAEDEED